MTYKGWYAIKQKKPNQTRNRVLEDFDITWDVQGVLCQCTQNGIYVL